LLNQLRVLLNLTMGCFVKLRALCGYARPANGGMINQLDSCGRKEYIWYNQYVILCSILIRCYLMPPLELDQLSPRNGEPLYVQIMRIIEEQIRLTHWKPGDKLPTQQQLADHFEVSLAPVKQALRELEKRGIVSPRQGRGTYVTDTTPLFQEIIEKDRIPSFTREMAERGRQAHSVVLTLERISSHDMPKASEQLQLADDDSLVFNLPHKRLGEIIERGLNGTEALSDVLRDDFGTAITASHQIITATGATPRDARYLNIPVDSPLLLVERTSYLDSGDPIEFVIDRRLPEFNFVVWLRCS